MKGSFVAAIIGLGCIVLVSCSEREGAAPVEELKWIPFNQYAAYHVVRPRDTLFSIAFRYEKDYQQLAKLNQLKPPFDIKPGQRIRLTTSGAAKQKLIKQIVVKKTKYHDSTQDSVQAHHSVQTQDPTQYSTLSNSTWLWPLKGTILTRYAPESGRKGIDITVDQQKTVKAASNGVVAYAGDGIPGYGHLIIVKHDNQFLTAYAHNAKNLVDEGDKVTKGQTIAYTGLIRANKRGVHFELRKNGKPVNPLNYLTNG